jgi:peptidyl-prolyl cis-trans isomerase B (cyclophilin B)
MSGGNGNDVLEGLNGNDFGSGGNGNDVIVGNKGSDSLSGDDGDDLIRGGQDGDFIFGGNGNDLIFGDLGTDAMRGGEGNDTFGFLPGHSPFTTEPDHINDFDIFGDDFLDLGAAGNAANFRNSGETAATFDGARAIADDIMNGTVIYVTVTQQGSPDSTIVFWDTDGDGSADEAIVLDGTPQVLLEANDII